MTKLKNNFTEVVICPECHSAFKCKDGFEQPATVDTNEDTAWVCVGCRGEDK